MSSQYRATVPPCPLCGGMLQDRAAADAIVDVCEECNAVWIDWFDGDLLTVAREVDVAKAIPVAAPGHCLCPRCRKDLLAEKLYGDGPHVYRCADCSGVLIPSVVFSEVVAMDASDVRFERSSPGPIARAIATLRRVFSSST